MDDRFVEAVLSVVERVPAGRVTTYGAIAEHVGSGGPRQVGRVMALYGGPVPWWRVVRADGSPPACHEGAAVREYLAEGTPRRTSGRLDLPRAFWDPGTDLRPVRDGSRPDEDRHAPDEPADPLRERVAAASAASALPNTSAGGVTRPAPT